MGALEVFKGKGVGVLRWQALPGIPGAAAPTLQAPVPCKPVSRRHVCRCVNLQNTHLPVPLQSPSTDIVLSFKGQTGSIANSSRIQQTAVYLAGHFSNRCALLTKIQYMADMYFDKPSLCLLERSGYAANEEAQS